MTESDRAEYDRERIDAILKMMREDTSPAALSAADKLDTIASSQDERRWGVEDGARLFRDRYTGDRDALYRDFLALDRRILDFAQELAAMQTSLSEDEANIVGGQQSLLERILDSGERGSRGDVGASGLREEEATRVASNAEVNRG